MTYVYMVGSIFTSILRNDLSCGSGDVQYEISQIDLSGGSEEARTR